jgi:hypothetical protein
MYPPRWNTVQTIEILRGHDESEKNSTYDVAVGHDRELNSFVKSKDSGNM